MGDEAAAFDIRDFSLWYGARQALYDVTIRVPARNVTAIIGPSGCGKSTFLRALNRMHELTPGTKITGSLRLFDEDLYGAGVDPAVVRRRVGMVFQKSNPFPTMSIRENVLVGLRLNGVRDQAFLKQRLEESLRLAALWDEVKDHLDRPGVSISGGQQQRLCIARALAVEPEVLLMDEPCSALDPIATAKIEELIQQLRTRYTVVIVTHNMQQAARCSDKTAFFYLGKLVEFGQTRNLFTHPSNPQTEAYVSGRFGWRGIPPMTHYAQEMERLKASLLAMASHAESAVARSIRALSERDDALARQVIQDDNVIDAFEIEIDDTAIHLLAKAPLATDLRLITVAMKISQNLERVGDEAVKIARRAIELNAEPQLKPYVDIPRMAAMSLEMLRDAITAFVNREPAKARAVIPRDVDVDNLNRQLHRELASFMVERPTTISRCLSLMVISKSLERVADHATNIAEEVVYLYEAVDIRHTAPKA